MSNTFYAATQLSTLEKEQILEKVTASILIKLIESMIDSVCFKANYSGGYRAGKNNRYAVYRNRKGHWRFKDFSDESGLPADFLGLICHKHLLNPKQQDDYLSMWHIASSLCSHIASASPTQSRTTIKGVVEDKDYVPNDDGRKLQVSFKVGYASTESVVSKMTLEYFKAKIQAPRLELRHLHKARLYPIASFQHRAGRKNQCHKRDYGFVSISGQNIKLKMPWLWQMRMRPF